MPAIQTEVTTEDPTATVQFRHAGGGVSSDVPIHQSYGYWSRPLAGSIHTLANVGGHAGRGISIASNDDRYRPSDMAQGDVKTQDNTSQSIHLSGGTTIKITANNTVTINAPSGVTVTTPTATFSNNVHITGSLQVDGTMHVTGTGGGGSTATINGSLTTTGDVTANGISLDGHHHTGVTTGGGNTGGPA